MMRRNAILVAQAAERQRQAAARVAAAARQVELDAEVAERAEHQRNLSVHQQDSRDLAERQRVAITVRVHQWRDRSVLLACLAFIGSFTLPVHLFHILPVPLLCH